MGGFLVVTLSSPELSFLSRQLKKPTRGILKGGAYGCQEKSQEESQKEKEVS